MTRLTLLLLLAVAPARAEPFFPTEPGATWQYEIEDPAVKGARSLTVRAVGPEKSNGKQLVRLETRLNDRIAKTEAVADEGHGLFCYERTAAEGKIVSLNPPQLLFPFPIAVGSKWETDDIIAGNETHLQFAVTAQEDVVVPAGTFQAFRAECDQPWPLSTTIVRWFAPGLGLVKDVTSTRGPGGKLLTRVTTSLTKFSHGRTDSNSGPSVIVSSTATTPTPTPVSAASPTFTIEIAQERDGPPAAELKSAVENIFVRWRGENLRLHSIIRIAWVAEDVGDIAPPNFIVDETRAEMDTSSYGTRFTLSRPKDGWATGKYRIDLFVDEALSATARVTIRD